MYTNVYGNTSISASTNSSIILKCIRLDEDGFRIIEEHERIFDLEEGGENLGKFIKSTDLRDQIRVKSSLITVLSIRRVKERKTKKKRKRFAKYFAFLKKILYLNYSHYS